MAAVLTDIANAVVAEIQAATLSQTPTVERVYVPVYDRASVSGLRVYVLATGQTITDANRAADDFEATIKVAIYKDVNPAVIAEVDAMVAFVQEVLDLFRSNIHLTAYDSAALTDLANDPVYDPAQLDQHRVFVSVITLKYTLLR